MSVSAIPVPPGASRRGSGAGTGGRSSTMSHAGGGAGRRRESTGAADAEVAAATAAAGSAASGGRVASSAGATSALTSAAATTPAASRAGAETRGSEPVRAVSRSGGTGAGGVVLVPSSRADYRKKRRGCCNCAPPSFFDLLHPTDFERLVALQQRMHVAFDVEHPNHLRTLRALWVRAFPDHTALFAAKHVAWRLLGFQNDSPASDFRGPGLFALQCMIYFAEAAPALFEVIVARGRTYPWAAVAINIAHILKFHLGLANPEETSPGFVRVTPSAKVVKSFCLLFVAYENVAEKLFVCCMKLVDTLWMQLLKSPVPRARRRSLFGVESKPRAAVPPLRIDAGATSRSSSVVRRVDGAGAGSRAATALDAPLAAPAPVPAGPANTVALQVRPVIVQPRAGGGGGSPSAGSPAGPGVGAAQPVPLMVDARGEPATMEAAAASAVDAFYASRARRGGGGSDDAALVAADDADGEVRGESDAVAASDGGAGSGSGAHGEPDPSPMAASSVTVMPSDLGGARSPAAADPLTAAAPGDDAVATMFGAAGGGDDGPVLRATNLRSTSRHPGAGTFATAGAGTSGLRAPSRGPGGLTARNTAAPGGLTGRAPSMLGTGGLTSRAGSAMWGSTAGGLTSRATSSMLRAPPSGAQPAEPAHAELALPPSLHEEAAAAAAAAARDSDPAAPPPDPVALACKMLGLDVRPPIPPEELTALLDFPQILLAVRNRLDGALSWMKPEATWVEVERLLMKGADRTVFKRTPVL